MARRRRPVEAPGRTEITDRAENHHQRMNETEESAERKVTDVETERETADGLDLEGTREAAEAIEQHIDDAENRSTEEFETDGRDLEGIHQDVEEFGGELQDRTDSMTRDSERISEARDRLTSEAAGGELMAAIDSAQAEIEFLQKQLEHSRQTLAESRRRYDEQRKRVQAEGGSNYA